jgi:hypothetical protein
MLGHMTEVQNKRISKNSEKSVDLMEL